jgi:cation:H+ antiporter
VTPIAAFDQRLIDFDLIWMLIFALLILPLVFLPSRMTLSWKEGLILLGAYTVFLAMLI